MRCHNIKNGYFALALGFFLSVYKFPCAALILFIAAFPVSVQNGSLHQKDAVHDNDFEPYLTGQSSQVGKLYWIPQGGIHLLQQLKSSDEMESTE